MPEESSKPTLDHSQVDADWSWRDQVLDVWLKVAQVALPMVTLVVLVLRPPPRFDVSSWVLIGCMVMLFAVRRGRSLPFAARVAVALAVLELAPLVLIVKTGPTLGATAALATGAILATLMLGRRAALVLVGFSIAAVLVGAYLTTSGRLSLSPDLGDPRSFQNWIRMAVSFILVMVVTIAAVDQVVTKIEAKHAEAAASLEQVLTQERALRTAYDELGVLHRKLESAREEERRFMARELHDQLGQTLTALKLRLQMEPKSQVRGPPELDSISMVDRLIERTRKLSLDLRPPLLDEMGLSPALEMYVAEQSSVSGLPITLSSHGLEAELSQELQLACFRVVQESVTNVLRHARAEKLEVQIERHGDELSIVVEDDGQGFSPDQALPSAAAQGHMGVVGMRERARALGGSFVIASEPGKGTRLRVSLPVATRG